MLSFVQFGTFTRILFRVKISELVMLWVQAKAIVGSGSEMRTKGVMRQFLKYLERDIYKLM